MLTIGTLVKGLPFDVTERGADAAEAVQALRSQCLHLFLGASSAPCHEGRLEYEVTIGCSACTSGRARC